MKNPKSIAFAVGISLALVGVTGCSHGGNISEEQAQTSQGPTIINPRANPEVVDLKGNLTPSHNAEVLADVKDMGADISNVKLKLFFSPVTDEKMRYFKQPIEVPMKNIGGSTWRAELTASDIKKLAVNGQSLRYEGRVLAENDKGQMTISKDPVEITINAAPATATG